MAVRREITSLNRARSHRDRQSMQRIIIKQGYLQKLPNAAKFGAAFKRPERRWFIFGVISNRDPYLEYYESEECIFTDPPLKMMFLDECRNVTRNQKTSRYSNIFTLVLRNRQLSLMAPTRDTMLEWCRAIENKLHVLGIIDSLAGDNDYISIPSHSIASHRRSLSMPPSSNISSSRPNSVRLSSTNAFNNSSLPAASSNYQRPRADPPVRSHSAVPVMDQSNSSVLTPDQSNSSVPVGRSNSVLPMPAVTEESSSSAVIIDRFSNTAPNTDADSNRLTFRQLSAEEEEDMERFAASLQGATAGVMPYAEYENHESFVGHQWQPGSGDLLHNGDEWETQERVCVSMPASLHPPRLENGSHVQRGQDSVIYSTPTRTNPEDHEVAVPVRTEDRATESRDTAADDREPLLGFSAPDSEDGSVSQDSRPQLLPFLPSYDESLSSPSSPVSVPSPSYDDVAIEPHVVVAESSLGGELSARGVENPPPYLSNRLLVLGGNSPLKLSQVQQLKDEISNPTGITVVIGRKDCVHALGLVNCFHAVWVVGWYQRSYPYFQSSLHIGDQLISVNGVPVRDAHTAKRMIKNCADKVDAVLVLRRLPHAKVLVVERSSGNLGLQLIAGTAEVGDVDAEGQAAACGLPNKSRTVDGGSLCNWYITEINSQPLNLLFRNGEVNRYLQALGTHLSIVLQPAQLVREFQRKLKKMNYYKDYLLQ